MIFKPGNLKKAYRYWKKNGFTSAFYASLERLQINNIRYEKRKLPEDVLEEQRKRQWEQKELFSILVPAYETELQHFHEMIDSVLAQTYPEFELVIADASPSDKLSREMQYYKDDRIQYIRLTENRGISGNTNAALSAAGGSYIGLLDHDDTLEPDALYCMMEAIQRQRQETGAAPLMLYSDEDKGNGDLSAFYEPHRKEDFNLDLLLSNNYICHFLVMQAELIKGLGFRREYDGAQDHDLVLRAAEKLAGRESRICHVPQILYHWRCHTGSTAENPESKMYAYEAGRRAVEDFCRRQGWKASVIHTAHLGFFRIFYAEDVLQQRCNLAAVGGRIVRGGKIVGGAYRQDGQILYQGLSCHFSGYMNRAAMQQDVYAADVRNMRVRPELSALLEQIRKETPDVQAASLRFGKEAKQRGYLILWDPFMERI